MNGLLKPSASPTGKTLPEIRQAMLDALGEHGALAHPALKRRVEYAEDIQDLWYLRGDVLTAISSSEGEAIARAHLARISEMFRGSLPCCLTARPSPLGR
jgi:hypothetical protein